MNNKQLIYAGVGKSSQKVWITTPTFFELLMLALNKKIVKVCPEATFYWKLLKIGSVSAKGIGKNLPNFQLGWPAPSPPTLPVIRLVLSYAPYRAIYRKTI